MKIKSNKKSIASMKLIVPIDGLITIDAEGCVEVSDKCAEVLVKNTSDWQYAEKDEDETETGQENETGSEGTESDDDEGVGADDEEDDDDSEKSERELLEEKVQNAKAAELKDMCSEAGFPEKEWKNLSKKDLAAYILQKFDEADDEED